MPNPKDGKLELLTDRNSVLVLSVVGSNSLFTIIP